MALAPAVVALAILAPNAFAAPAAVDQYTEQPPSGPGGPETSIGTSDNQSSQNESNQDAGGGAPAQSPPKRTGSEASGGEASAPAPVEVGGSAPAEAPHRRTHAPRSAPTTEHARLPVRAAAVSSGGDGGPTLFGYPATTFIAIVAALLVGALAVRFAMAAHRRRATAAPNLD